MPSDQDPPGNYPRNYSGGTGPAPGELPRKQPEFFSQQRDPYQPQDQESQRQGSMDPFAQRRRSMRVLAAIVSLGLFTFVIWYSYHQGLQDGAESAPQLITADVNPTKVRPDEPGGMDPPPDWATGEVYDVIGSSAAKNQNVEETLRPPPEKPLPRGQGGVSELPEPSFQKTSDLGIPVPIIPQQPPPHLEPNEVSPPPVSPVQKPRQLLPPSPAESTQQAIAPTSLQGGFHVQLGAFRSEDVARKAWTQIKEQHKDILASMGAAFPRADLGPKGVFFRIRAGPVASKSAAKNICSELAKRKTGCLVIRP